MVDESTERDFSLHPTSTVRLKTERLLLDAPHREDAADLAFLANNKKIAQMLSRMPHPYGIADAHDFIARSTDTSERIRYAIRLAATGRLIGLAGIVRHERRDHYELGYWIGEPFWGHGYATEAARASVDFALAPDGLDLPLLEARCRVNNPASRRVIERCGFQYHGQGMRRSRVAGSVAVEVYRLSRELHLSLKQWGATGIFRAEETRAS